MRQIVRTMVARKRLIERLLAASALPVTLVMAPAGFGKSVALDALLYEARFDAIRFDVRRAHGSLARFVRAFAAALEPALPRIGQSLAIAYERARQSADASDVLAGWLAEHLEGSGYTVVIDDLHHCQGERAIATLIARTIERTRGSVRWILAGRCSSDLPYATWFARGDAALPIGEDLLRVTAAESLAFAACLAPRLERDLIERTRLAAAGSASVLAFALRTFAREPAAAERLLNGGGDLFAACASDVLARFSPDERTLLIESAAYPEIDEALPNAAGATSSTFASIAAKAPHVFEFRGGVRRFHALFAGVLLEHLKRLGWEAVRDASLRAAHGLERSGRIAEALASHIRDRQDAELVRIIEAHGLVYLENGYGESIGEAIEALDPLVQMTSPSVLAIKAMSESTIGRFDTAESWFALALNRASGPLRLQVAYQYGSHLLRFFRAEAARTFEEIAGDPDVSEKLRAYALSALGPAYVFEGRPGDAWATSREAIFLARRLAKPHVIAKTHHQASFVAIHGGDARQAKELASVALEIATEQGYFDVAAGALGVLHDVAADIDDDPSETVRLLEAMDDCAAKSGSPINQLMALVAILEIETERGDEDAVARIETKLRTIDSTFAGRTTYEALLPARALRATWTGDYTGAYRLLNGSAEQQWSPDRKALRHAEIAFYAAAAGFDRSAIEAIRSAEETLARLDRSDLRAQRTRLMLGLTRTVLGHTEAAAMQLRAVDQHGPVLTRRLAAFRRALGNLHERYRGVQNQHDVLESLAELSAAGFAGFARAISMLPMSDYAARRAARLDARERALALRIVDGAAPEAGDGVATIVDKLGCADEGALVRAVTWHRRAFENAGRGAAGPGDGRRC